MRERKSPDHLNQMAFEDGASQVVGEIPYLLPLNSDRNSDIMFVLPGEDSGAIDTEKDPH